MNDREATPSRLKRPTHQSDLCCDLSEVSVSASLYWGCQEFCPAPSSAGLLGRTPYLSIAQNFHLCEPRINQT